MYNRGNDEDEEGKTNDDTSELVGKDSVDGDNIGEMTASSSVFIEIKSTVSFPADVGIVSFNTFF